MQIDTGNTFSTPQIIETTSYFVESINEENGVVCKSDRIEVLAVVDTTTSLINPGLLAEIEIYPNPANKNLIVEFEPGNSFEGIISLKDLNGKAIFSETIDDSNFLSKRTYNLYKIPSGIYLLSIVSEGSALVQKIVVQKD